jgi:osmoprotectant transport system ATP-binding protein
MIEFQNVTKIYPGGVAALDEVSFTVREGELVVLIGPSGCGKTTALKMVNRLVDPTGGRVIVNGQDVSRLDPVQLRLGIGYVIQQVGLFPHMTIADNVALVPRLKEWPESRRRDRAEELLNLVGLPPDTFRSRYPRELSGGQQQRVGVARALAGDPAIVLMDEPFGAVDPIIRRQLQDEMRKIQATVRKTILFVTHDISEAFLLGDRIGIMKSGHLLQLASPEELLRQPVNGFVAGFVGGDGLWRKLDFLRVHDVAQPPPCAGSSHWTPAWAYQFMEQQGLDNLLVLAEDGRLLGRVAMADLRLRAEMATVAEALTPATTLLKTTLLKDALPLIAREQATVVPVVDEVGRLIGAVTHASIMTLFSELVQSPDAPNPPGD